MTSRISAGVTGMTNAPRLGKSSRIPSEARRRNASRTGVRETPTDPEISPSLIISPAAKVPSRIRSRVHE